MTFIGNDNVLLSNGHPMCSEAEAQNLECKIWFAVAAGKANKERKLHITLHVSHMKCQEVGKKGEVVVGVVSV